MPGRVSVMPGRVSVMPDLIGHLFPEETLGKCAVNDVDGVRPVAVRGQFYRCRMMDENGNLIAYDKENQGYCPYCETAWKTTPLLPVLPLFHTCSSFLI